LISKELIIDTIGIAQFIVDQKAEGMILSRYPENQEKYNKIIKPKIESLTTKYGNKPDDLLNDFLNNYIISHKLDAIFKAEGKKFYTQVVNPFTWACIFNKDTSNLKTPHSRSSQFPQLYVLIDNKGIRFGFCYGFHIPDNDVKITTIKENEKLLKNTFDLLVSDKDLKIFGHDQQTKGVVEIKITSYGELKEKWSKETEILKTFSKDSIPDNVEAIITGTLDNLLDLFKQSSLAVPQKTVPLIQHVVSVNYWQIAPKAQASAWDLCIEKGIIPIYFNEYLQNLTEDILTYNLDQLTTFCKKNNPSATKGQVASNVELIWNFIHDVRIGDYVLANKGKSLALGWGIVKSEAKIFKTGEDITFYRDVDWKNTTLNRDLIQNGLGKNFFRTIYQMTKDHFESIINMTSTPENPLFTKIQKVLDYKKQVILYGPPGTGKTWAARNFIKSKNIPENSEKTIRSEKKFFWYNVRSESWTTLHRILEKQEVEEELGVDDKVHVYDRIEEGDIVLLYDIGSKGRLIGIASCEGKLPPSQTGIWDIILKGMKLTQGPSWETIEKDPILRNSEPVKYYKTESSSHPQETEANPQLQSYPQHLLWNIMFPLTRQEAFRLLELAQVSVNDLNIPITKETENVETPEKSCPYDFVTFHPSYAYEEFIEGLRPVAEKGNISYEIQEGIFKRASREALNAVLREAEIDQVWNDHAPVPTFSPEETEKIQTVIEKVPCYLVIDEINRGDISRIFGELITLIEADKRIFCENEITPELPYSKMKFGIPPNLFIIGTMNTADRSISLMDIALRRRFGFIELLSDEQVLTAKLMNDTTLQPAVREYRNLAIRSLKTINEKLSEKYDLDHQIGHSYVMKLSQVSSEKDTIEMLANIWKYEIVPLLQEYFYDSPEKLLYVTNNRFFEKRGSSFVLKSEEDIITALNAVAGAG